MTSPSRSPSHTPARQRPLDSRFLGALTDLPGVGPARAAALGRLGIANLRDLLFLMPAGAREWPEVIPAAEALACEGSWVRVRGTVTASHRSRFGGKRSVVRATLEDASGKLEALWFNQPWVIDRVVIGEQVELYGQLIKARSGLALSAPRIGHGEHALPQAGLVEPAYPSCEGLGAETVGKLCRLVAERFGPGLGEPLPDAVLAELDLPTLSQAVQNVHLPRSLPAFEAGRRRLALEPLLGVQARLHERRAGRGGGRARVARVDDALHAELVGRFPFQLTGDQAQVVLELRRDLGRSVPMRRLLQGEVGAGKTAMALYAAMAVIENDGQVALMAPTELLAEQHYYGTRELCEAQGIQVALLTGSVPKDERQYLLKRLARGELQLLIGTHALFSASVRFRRLDLVVIDEQHRFGVDQRAAIAGKGPDVHLLLMTATPIPRTLALSVYGDLEISTLRELPPGRGSVTTRWLKPKQIREVSALLSARLEAGEQVYWVCPRIGSEEGISRTAAAEKRYEQALQSSLATYGVELVHGRVPAAERAHRLDRFRRGEIGMLVATTVIEVGVDVPSATVMVIENAERLGLAQLHQLRGRVGRGPLDSQCLLIGDERAAERFRLLERTNDGFELAEADLAQRGMGDLAGVRQSGVNLEGLADPERDVDLVLAARDLMRTRPDLRASYLRANGGRQTP
ncbi:MAG: ATP-dependent DNA helicase RecG [Planctomycetota bacterium]